MQFPESMAGLILLLPFHKLIICNIFLNMKKVNKTFTFYVAGLTLSIPFYSIINHSWSYYALTLPFCDLNISYGCKKINKFSLSNLIDICIFFSCLHITTEEQLNFILMISFISALLIYDNSVHG